MSPFSNELIVITMCRKAISDHVRLKYGISILSENIFHVGEEEEFWIDEIEKMKCKIFQIKDKFKPDALESVLDKKEV